MAKKQIVFIINPISGNGKKKKIPTLIDEIINKEIFDIEIRFTEYAGHAREISRQCAEEGKDIVVAVGGDGTINEVATGLTHSQTALAIVPCGSGNGLARHLMLPLSVKGALGVINKCEIHDLDYGEINSQPFFCTCGMGFDAYISKKFTDSGKRGALNYFQLTLKEGLRYKPTTYDVTLDGKRMEPYNAFLISICNASQYGNDAYIAPQASMADGYLDVVFMDPFDVLEAPEMGLDMLNKTLNKSMKIKSFKAKDILIRRPEEAAIHYDGDPVIGPEELHIKIHEKGIRVVVNPNAKKSRRKPNLLQNSLARYFTYFNIVRDEVTHPVRRAKAINSYVQGKFKGDK